MGLGNCCCLGGDFYLRSHCGTSPLSSSKFNDSTSGTNLQNPINFNFAGSNTEKFHSNAFQLNSENVGIYSYDITAENDGSYVYVASGDFGLEVFKNNSGILSKERTISLGINQRFSDETIGSGLVIGGSRGSLYGYERDPFNGAYAVCMSKNKRFVYVAVGNEGIYYVDTKTSNSFSLVLSSVSEGLGNSIINSLILFDNFLYFGTTGYSTPTDNLKFHRHDNDFDYLESFEFPQASGVFIYRLEEFDDFRNQNPNPIDPTSQFSLTYQTEFNQGSLTLGVNDLFVHKKSFINEQGVEAGNTGLYIALGKNIYTESNGEHIFNQYGGAVRVILNIKTSQDAGSENFKKKVIESTEVSNDITATGFTGDDYENKKFRQPIKTITADEDKIYLSTATRYGKVEGSVHFPTSWDNAESNVESCTFLNNWTISNSTDEIGMKRERDYCEDKGVLSFFQTRAWELDPSSGLISLKKHGKDYLNNPFVSNVAESFVSDIKFFGKTKVSCYKGLGLIIGDKNDFDKQIFKTKTMRENYDTCEPYWQSGSGMWSYEGGFVNLTHSWSPIKSFKAGNYIFVLNSMQCVANESGPGYFFVYNEDNKELFVGSAWETKPSSDISRACGVTVLQQEKK